MPCDVDVDAEADAIIEVVSEKQCIGELARSVIWFEPEEHASVHASITKPFDRTPKAMLGSLNRLPPELITQVLGHLDLKAVFFFRQVNLQGRELITELRPYQRMVEHGLNAFCALLRTRLAGDVTLSAFYDALCTPNCSLCGNFGGYISLLNWIRCCHRCMQTAPELQMRSMSATRKQYRMNKAQQKELRSFMVLPGKYMLEQSPQNTRMTVVSLAQAIELWERDPHIMGPIRQAASLRFHKFNFMGTCALPYYDARTGEVDEGVICYMCPPRHGMFDQDGHGLWSEPRQPRQYSRAGLLAHFRGCKWAQLAYWKWKDME